MSSLDDFEKQARKIRRGLRRLPLLEPLVDRVGMWLWHRHLDRIALIQDLPLPDQVTLPASTIRRGFSATALPAAADRRDGAVELDGGWDLAAVPLNQEVGPAPPDSERESTAVDGAQIIIAFDRLGRACHVSEGTPLERVTRGAGGRVTAIVALRHARWARMARRIMAYAHQRGGSAYQPYLHPDLDAVPADHGEERFAQISSALPLASGTLLDLGANAGYFSHRFEEVGFDCVAVERSSKEAYFLTALRDALERKFVVVKGSLTEVDLPAADVTLALSIFHHFLKTEAGHRELEGFLRRLATRYLLFEPHLPEDPQMRNAAHNPEPEDFADWVGRCVGLEHRTLVGRAATGRPLFLLTSG
jgi:hypothetical protein